jgi:hypothetical protein
MPVVSVPLSSGLRFDPSVVLLVVGVLESSALTVAVTHQVSHLDAMRGDE